MDPNLGLGLLGLLIIAFLGGALVRRPPLQDLSPWLQLSLAAAGAWTLGEICAAEATHILSKRLALDLLYLGSIFLPALWLVTVFRWVGLHSPSLLRVDRSLHLAPVVLSAGFFLAFLAQPWHGLLVEPVVGTRNVYGPGFLWMLSIGYLEVAIAIALSLATARRHPSREVRRAGLLMAAAPVVTLFTNAAYVMTDVYEPSQATGLILAGSCLVAACAVWWGRELWLLPVAIREVVEHDASGVVILGPKGRPCYWNAAAERLLDEPALSTDSLLWHTLLGRLRPIDGVPPADAPGLAELVREAGPAGTVAEKLSRPGQYLRLCLHPIVRRGRQPATALRIEEVSERIRLERLRTFLSTERIEAEKLRHLTQVASDLADGFHARLRAISASARETGDESIQASGVLERLQRIAQEADQALDLTQQLLAIGGRVAPRTAATPVLALIEETIAQLEAEESASVCLASYVDPALPMLRADAGQVVQGLAALARHAHEQAASVAGHLTLTAEMAIVEADAAGAYHPPLDPGHHVLISLITEGRPMSRRERDRILGRRAPSRATRSELALSAGVARLHANGAAVSAGSANGSNVVSIAFPVASELASRDGDPIEGPPAGAVLDG